MSTEELNSIATEAADAAEKAGTEPTDAGAGTTDAPEGTTGEPNLVDQLKTALQDGKVSTQDLGFLDRHFQSAYNKRIDRLERALSAPVHEAAAKRGMDLPAGKTIMDLMTEDGGKPFGEFLRSVIEASNAPIKERLEKADVDQALRDQMGRAQQQFPDVKKNFPQIVDAIDRSEYLTEIITKDKGFALPAVMYGVARDIRVKELEQNVANLTALLKKNGVAVKVGESTTKAKTSGSPPAAADKPKSLREIAAAAAEGMAEFGRAN